MSQLGFFDLSDPFSGLSERGAPLQVMNKIIDFEGFCSILDMALQYSDGKKGDCPPYDPVAMFKVLLLAAQSNVSDARMEFLICDRWSWLRFLGFESPPQTRIPSDVSESARPRLGPLRFCLKSLIVRSGLLAILPWAGRSLMPHW